MINILKNAQNITLCLVLIGLLNACIEPYNNSFNLNASPLVVDGFITDQIESDTIMISVSKATASTSYLEPLNGCKVVVIENGGSPVPLQEFGQGRYVTPVGFRGKIGNSYQLQFITSDGRKYESTAEKMTAVPAIQKVYDKFDTKALTNDKGTIFYPASVVYLDAQDPASERNFYLWRYLHYERQDICATCDKGTYNKATEKCVAAPIVRGFTPPTYDYQCEGTCWAIAYGSTVNVFSDINSNGQSISGRIVAKIPFYNISGCLVEIQQASISEQAYTFYRVLDSQGQSTGSLTDTPPAAIVGNIKNINAPSEAVVGYFGASSIKKIRYWIDRKDAVGKITTLLAHEPVFEPSPIPTLAKCFPLRTQTPFKPNGWLN